MKRQVIFTKNNDEIIEFTSSSTDLVHFSFAPNVNGDSPNMESGYHVRICYLFNSTEENKNNEVFNFYKTLDKKNIKNVKIYVENIDPTNELGKNIEVFSSEDKNLIIKDINYNEIYDYNEQMINQMIIVQFYG